MLRAAAGRRGKVWDMPLHPDVANFLTTLSVAPPPDYQSFDAAASHAHLTGLRARRAATGPGDPVARVVDVQVGPSGVPVRLYWPDLDGPHSAIIYFHGGGWVTGDLEMHDATCRSLARRCGSVVVNVDYRLAPEYPFPVPVEDAYEVLTWLSETADELGVDRRRIGLAGSSSGGNIAAALAMYSRDRAGPRAAVQLLMYPVLDARMDTTSYQRYGTGYLLEAGEMAWFWQAYLGADADASNPYASPAQAPDLADLPPAVVVLPECDPLRDEGIAYADRLVAAGVAADVVHVPGQIHGFVAFASLFPDADGALARAAALCTVRLASVSEEP